MSNHPRCAALLQGGARCRSVAVSGSVFCQHHLSLVDEHGEEALKQGEHLPRRRSERKLGAVREPIIAETVETPADAGNGRADPSSVRPLLAEAAASSIEEIRRVLVETATGANKQVWATVTCKHCDKQGRYEVVIPDYRVRLDAVEALLREGLGRVPQSEPAAVPRLPQNVEQAQNTSWHDMCLVVAAEFAGELEALRDGNIEALLRERLGGLAEGPRRVLREALLDSERA
jgi:hypothetical protein